MSDLSSLPFDRLSSVLSLLSRLGLTAEVAEECLENKYDAAVRAAGALLQFSPHSSALPDPAKFEPLWRRVDGNPNAILVNIGFDTKRYYRSDVQIIWRWGRQEGWVLIEKRKDGELYQDGRKVLRHREPEQKKCGGWLKDDALHTRLAANMADVVLHPNIRNALMVPENQHLLPESWKESPCFIFFWAVGFRHPHVGRYVEYIHFERGVWSGDLLLGLNRCWGEELSAACVG